jgi:hypothetical protein
MIRPLTPLTEQTVRGHLRALGISGMLTQTWRRMYRPMAVQVTPEGVLAALHQAGVRPVLMGTHGIGGWRSQARATQDVDVLVRKKDIRRAVSALQAAYPDLEVRDTLVVTRFWDSSINDVVIDVMKPTQPIFSLVFRHVIAVGETHDIPQLEMALISKFAAMTSPRREPSKKLVDGGDFMDVVAHNRSAIDLRKLRRLAETLDKGAGDEIMALIADIDAGRMIRF